MTNLIEKLAQLTRMAKSDVEHVTATAFRRYKVYTIPKRDGKGTRTIAHPARELKALQHALISLRPHNLVAHKNAMAYEKGASILKNAESHKDGVWLARFDITNFFNSIKSQHWIDVLQALPCDQEFRELSSKVFFWKPSGANSTCLSVGAPSSPFASNRFMYSFDKKMTDFCVGNGLNYTRYADDMAISSSEKMDMTELERIIVRSFPIEGVFNINRRKTRISGKAHRRAITGLIINNEGVVSLGRSRKRQIEAMVHRYSLGRSDETPQAIRGHLSFLRMVDHAAFDRLVAKYSGRVDLFKSGNSR
ncbi:MAG: retron St85 family RNA-directed DNA polymerase [Hyphomicrobium sp.]